MKKCSAQNSEKSIVAKLFAIAIGFTVISGCSQNIDNVAIRDKTPINYFFVGDADHQGGNPQTAEATSVYMNTETLGGNFTRTHSSSPSFQMTSGIGVD